MQSRILFVVLFAIICLSFVFANVDTEESAAVEFSLPAWKLTWKTLTPEERADVESKFVTWYKNAPKDVQDNLLEQVVENVVKDELLKSLEVENDLAEEEFICAGLCIGAGIAIAAGIAWIGHEVGKNQGAKAPPIHHHHRDDDQFLDVIGRLLKINEVARDITKTLLSSPNPGVHTHIYHNKKDDDESIAQAQPIDIVGWARTWYGLPEEERAEIIEKIKTTVKTLSPEVRQQLKDRAMELIEAQKALALEDADLAEEVEFICGGFCIAAAVAIGVGIFTGAKSAGAEKTQRHIHHHY